MPLTIPESDDQCYIQSARTVTSEELETEMSLFRAMTLSLVLVITTIYVLYLNYLLLG
jgi:hypothetical protein